MRRLDDDEGAVVVAVAEPIEGHAALGRRLMKSMGPVRLGDGEIP